MTIDPPDSNQLHAHVQNLSFARALSFAFNLLSSIKLLFQRNGAVRELSVRETVETRISSFSQQQPRP